MLAEQDSDQPGFVPWVALGVRAQMAVEYRMGVRAVMELLSLAIGMAGWWTVGLLRLELRARLLALWRGCLGWTFLGRFVVGIWDLFGFWGRLVEEFGMLLLSVRF